MFCRFVTCSNYIEQPCDRNQQSEQIAFIERKDTERNRHEKEVFTIVSNDASEYFDIS